MSPDDACPICGVPFRTLWSEHRCDPRKLQQIERARKAAEDRAEREEGRDTRDPTEGESLAAWEELHDWYED